MLLMLLVLCVAAPALAEGGTTLRMMGLENDGSERNWADSAFFRNMAEITGVSFTFEQYSDPGAYAAGKTNAFAKNELPDVLFKAGLTPEEEMAYHNSGQLVDLAPYLEEYAPNLYAILEARPDWRAVITQPNGAITSLPALSGADREACVWINQSWLTALNLAMPTTIEAYTEVLRAFRDGDPNGNGKQDEIPLSLVGPWEAKFLLHAFGLTPNDYNIYVEDGTVVFAPFEEEYRAFVEWLKMAHDEKLIDPDTFRQMQGTRSNLLSTAESNAPTTIGGMVTIAPYTLVDMGITTSYAVLKPLVYEGKQVYRQLLNGVTRGTFAVTSACEDIPAALRWVDYLYSEAGGRLANAGVEGQDYTVAEDGTWTWNTGEDYYLLSELVASSIIAGDSKTPGLEPAAFMRNSQITDDNYARRQVDAIREYLVEPFPVTWPTDAAVEERIAALQEALGACVDMAIANFAMGKTELNDNTWNAFLEELRALGAEEFVSLWQAKYDEIEGTYPGL